MQIPGITHLVGKDNISNSILLLTGPSGAGKSIYCRQFLLDGISQNEYCIYLSSNLTMDQYSDLFSNFEKCVVSEYSIFINPYINDIEDNMKLSYALDEVTKALDRAGISKKHQILNSSSLTHSKSAKPAKNVRFICDSLTHLLALFEEKTVETFITKLYFILKSYNASAIFTLSTPSSNEYETNRISSIFDGLLEMKLEDNGDALVRRVRMLSIKGIHHDPLWIEFNISNEGTISFTKRSNYAFCFLCKDPIIDRPVIYTELPFHADHLEIYKKLVKVYDFSLSGIGIPTEPINANFFFIDIVGLSDPLLSVNKQREKIETLNSLILICEAFKADDKKIILPTGDGMVIGFPLNPELPLQLGMQLHRELRKYNYGKNNEDSIIVRIGLSTGPVFTVNDIKNNQNYWGPGIILARRVMDIGNEWHILIADNLAETLIALKEEYKKTIKLIGNYRIKHGQEIRLYSLYSNEFGNPELPIRKDF
jgi:KaiC/GvpD/RAD55 family RecA-like ATPase/class 3 adenylate cyclase